VIWIEFCLFLITLLTMDIGSAVTSSIVGAVLLGAIGSLVAETVKDSITLQFGKSPRLSGTKWKIRHSTDRADEDVEITHQFGTRFSGFLYTPLPDNGGLVKQKIRGRFIFNQTHAQYTLEGIDSQVVYGTGMLKINADRQSGSGATSWWGPNVDESVGVTQTMFTIVRAG
jgi:hypothetical protein